MTPKRSHPAIEIGMSTRTIACGSYGVPSPLNPCAAFVLCVTLDDRLRSNLKRPVAIWLPALYCSEILGRKIGIAELVVVEIIVWNDA